MAQPPDPPRQPPPVDPIVARRRQIGHWADVGQRLGYLLFGMAVVLFVVAVVTDLPPAMVSAIVVTMALGSLVLAPSIVVGYGVRAAEREDREPRGPGSRPSPSVGRPGNGPGST